MAEHGLAKSPDSTGVGIFNQGDNSFARPCIRIILPLLQKYVGLGGAFLGNKGKFKMHVMPDFPARPIACGADVDKWLAFYEMRAPIVFLSALISGDPGMELRVEHTHGFRYEYRAPCSDSDTV